MRPTMILATALPIGTVLALGAAYLAWDRWGARLKAEAARELRAGTSPIHRRPKLSERHDHKMRQFHERQAQLHAMRCAEGQ